MNDKNNCRIDIVTESGKNIYYINSRAHDWLILNIKLTVCLGQLYKIVQYFVQFHDLHHCGQSVYWISFLHRLYWNKEMMNTICRYKYHRHSSIHQSYLLEDNYNLYSLGSRYSLPAWTCLAPGCSETPHCGICLLSGSSGATFSQSDLRVYITHANPSIFAG